MLKNFRNKLLTVAAGGDGAGDVADGVGASSTSGSPIGVASAPADVDVDAPVSGFICPQCRRDFPDPEALQIHFLAHLEEPTEAEKPPEAAAAAVVGASAGATPASESKRGSIFKSRGSKGGQQQQTAAPTSTFYPGEEAEEFVCPMCEQRFALPDQLQVSHGYGCDLFS